MIPPSSSVRSRVVRRLWDIRPTPRWISLKWCRSKRTISRRINGVQRSAMTSLARDTGQTCSYFTGPVCGLEREFQVQKLHEQLHCLHWRSTLARTTLASEATPSRGRSEGDIDMDMLVKFLMWPVIALLFIGGTHLVAEGVRPALQDLIGTAVVMPIH